jgi:hypothetical protein
MSIATVIATTTGNDRHRHDFDSIRIADAEPALAMDATLYPFRNGVINSSLLWWPLALYKVMASRTGASFSWSLYCSWPCSSLKSKVSRTCKAVSCRQVQIDSPIATVLDPEILAKANRRSRTFSRLSSLTPSPPGAADPYLRA